MLFGLPGDAKLPGMGIWATIQVWLICLNSTLQKMGRRKLLKVGWRFDHALHFCFHFSNGHRGRCLVVYVTC